MIKKISLLLSSCMLTTSMYAGANYGLSSATFADGDAGYGFSVGGSGFFYQPENLNGFGIGWAIDMGYFTLDEIKNINDDAGMLINFDLTTGFEIDKTTLYAGIGYGVGQIGSIYYDGLNYQAAVEYNITPNNGVGLKYNHNNCDLVVIGNATTDLDIITIYYKHTSKKK